MTDKKTKKKSKHMKVNQKKQIILNIILFIAIAIFIYSTYNVIIWIRSSNKTKELEEGLYNQVISEEVQESKNEVNNEEFVEEVKEFTVDFKKLKETNSDVIAWIRIEDTRVSYPILQGKTDEYYLRKDIYKDYSLAGSIFVDASTKKDFSDENTSIYGHNMKDDSMFADLFKIYDGDLGKKVTIEIYTEKEKMEYRVFSSYIAKPALSIVKKNFTSSQKESYVINAINKSSIKFDVKVDNKKDIITLLTCDDTSQNRLIINAVKL